MEHSDFIITLLCNVDAPGNTLAEFTTLLPQPIFLRGKWTVGLLDISYTKSWYNVKRDYEIGIFDSNGAYAISPRKLEAGMYESENELVQAIQKEIGRACNSYKELRNLQGIRTRQQDKAVQIGFKEVPTLTANKNSRRITLTAGQTDEASPRILYVELHAELEQMLGLSANNVYHSPHMAKDVTEVLVRQKFIKGSVQGFNAYDLNGGIHNICVYCNLIEPQIVGDSFASVLRVVQIPVKKFGEQAGGPFANPFYFPLISNYFQQVKISLRDDNGELIPFKFGRTLVTLHFKNEQLP